jgi:hypothetical protein
MGRAQGSVVMEDLLCEAVGCPNEVRRLAEALDTRHQYGAKFLILGIHLITIVESNEAF